MADTNETIAQFARVISDRLEDAHKRECGDCAKMRKALEATLDLFWDIHNANRSPQSNQAYAVIKQIKAALAAPPRNCDMLLVVDGPADNNADKAWLVFKQHNPDAYFDVPGLLRCIYWLLSTVTNKEGGAE